MGRPRKISSYALTLLFSSTTESSKSLRLNFPKLSRQVETKSRDTGQASTPRHSRELILALFSPTLELPQLLELAPGPQLLLQMLVMMRRRRMTRRRKRKKRTSPWETCSETTNTENLK